MIRQWSLNLVLLFLVISLVAIALFQPGIEKEKSVPSLTELQFSFVKKITITRPAHKQIVLSKSKKKWRLVEPINARANEFSINELFSISRTPSLKQLGSPESSRLEEFGFKTPRAIIQYNDSTLTFGDLNPVSKQQYVLVDHKVHMIDGNVLLLLTRQYTDFIERKLLTNSESPTALIFPDGTKLTQTNGSWNTNRKSMTVSADALTKLVSEWRYANAIRVTPYQKGIVQGTVRILYNDKKSELKLGIVSRKPELVFVRKEEGLQYHFPADASKRLFLPKK